jgi:DNA-binding NarL/FixJ family response regulator
MIESSSKLTVAVCETQPVMVEGIKAVLASCPDLKFLGTTDNLAIAIQLSAQLAPDVIVMDKAFGVQAVLDWLGKLRESRITAAAVVWGTSISEPEALRFLQNGARGIIRKTAEVDKLIACLRSVAAGVTWMEDAVFRDAPRSEASPRYELTPREQQVMELVEQGLKNKEIGGELGIRPGTVKIHLKHIFEKTGVRGRYGLALSGLKHRGIFALNTM